MDILVVDDSKAMRMIVSRTIKKAGFEHADIRQAGNGIEGLERVSEATPDFILCDWNMPEMNGIDFLRQLRRDGNPVKFGFVTSESTSDMEELARSEGAEFLLTKPFTVEKFREVLEPVLA